MLTSKYQLSWISHNQHQLHHQVPRLIVGVPWPEHRLDAQHTHGPGHTAEIPPPRPLPDRGSFLHFFYLRVGEPWPSLPSTHIIGHLSFLGHLMPFPLLTSSWWNSRGVLNDLWKDHCLANHSLDNMTS
jgi:hypothetical protein